MGLDAYGPNPVKTKPSSKKQTTTKDGPSSSRDVYTRL